MIDKGDKDLIRLERCRNIVDVTDSQTVVVEEAAAEEGMVAPAEAAAVTTRRAIIRNCRSYSRLMEAAKDMPHSA